MKKISISMLIWIILCIVTICAIAYVSGTFFLAKTAKIVHPEVTFELENYGTIKIELYPEHAPNTVANFIKLAQAGYYNDKIIYGKDELCLYVGRNVDGEPVMPRISLITETIEPDSELDYDYEIPGEFMVNGFNNKLRHEKGVISLIRSDYTTQLSNLVSESYNSGSAQIGIMMGESKNLDGYYAAFGRIVDGLDILERINSDLEIEPPEEDENGEEVESAIQVFAEKPVIKNVTVETYGVNYGMPIVNKAFDYMAYLYELLSQYEY